jgi:ABC-type polysaccharide/polyol phosphate transport system ATPase subunit
MTTAPVVIELRDVRKTFRVPARSADTLRDRALHPFTRAGFRELRALRGVSFDVHQGEFFGIVGRNGSGKSTLLKILSSIYRADAGRVRIAGRLAPFIELGVGFNPDLTARENVALNGVMMGLGRRQAAAKLDGVLDFAELREFADLKLKNYSSGMLVRLAFAVMVEADADVMLIDEVLAVGDAAFAQKCMDVFREKRKAGKTVVLVTHDMATVQDFCDRAMLLHHGDMRFLGDPEEAALRYYRLNFDTELGRSREHGAVRVEDVWLEDPAGARVEQIDQFDPLTLNLVLEARDPVRRPVVAFQVARTTDETTIFGWQATLGGDDEEGDGWVAAGQRLHVRSRLRNLLIPGPYRIVAHVLRDGTLAGGAALHVPDLLEFDVRPRDPDELHTGMVSVTEDVRAVVRPAATTP